MKYFFIFFFLFSVIITGYTADNGRFVYNLTGETAGINSPQNDTTVNQIPPAVFTLKNGKTFTVLQAVESEYLYDIRIIGNGFSVSNDTILIDEVEHVDTIIVADINNDGFEELYLFTKGFSPGEYAHVFGISSDSDKNYKEIVMPGGNPEDLIKGGIFEGYSGYDVYHIKDNKLERVFPVYNAGDFIENPSGGKRTLYYTIEKAGAGFIYKQIK